MKYKVPEGNSFVAKYEVHPFDDVHYQWLLQRRQEISDCIVLWYSNYNGKPKYWDKKQELLLMLKYKEVNDAINKMENYDSDKHLGLKSVHGGNELVDQRGQSVISKNKQTWQTASIKS